jgi:hypothetical protein
MREKTGVMHWKASYLISEKQTSARIQAIETRPGGEIVALLRLLIPNGCHEPTGADQLESSCVR